VGHRSLLLSRAWVPNIISIVDLLLLLLGLGINSPRRCICNFILPKWLDLVFNELLNSLYLVLIDPLSLEVVHCVVAKDLIQLDNPLLTLAVQAWSRPLLGEGLQFNKEAVEQSEIVVAELREHLDQNI